MAFVFGDLFSQSCCASLDLLGIDGHTDQFGQPFATFLEADQGTHRAYHARAGGRERGVFYAQLPIARAEAVTAGRAMIVGALQLQGTENALHLLAAASDQARFLPTTTTRSRSSLVSALRRCSTAAPASARPVAAPPTPALPDPGLPPPDDRGASQFPARR